MTKHNIYSAISIKGDIDYQIITSGVILIILANFFIFISEEFLLPFLILSRIYTSIYVSYNSTRLNRNPMVWVIFTLISPVITSFTLGFVGFRYDYSAISEYVSEARQNYRDEMKAEKKVKTGKSIEITNKHEMLLQDSLPSILRQHGIYDEEENESSGLMKIIGSFFLPKNIDNSDSTTFTLKQERIGNLVTSMVLVVAIVVLLGVYY